MLRLIGRNMPYEDEAFIHLFCLFSKQKGGQYYAATLIVLCLLRLNFTLAGSRNSLLWSLQSLLATCPQRNVIT